MKKFFLALMAVALALALAAPAMAGLKLTSSGRMDVYGAWVSGNIIDRNDGRDDANDDSADWYEMELVIDPILHINEKVRIHARITMMEHIYGTGGFGAVNNSGLNYRGENNLWLERLWLSFPLFGGTLRVGRMPGGSWGFPFADNDANRDRILWLGPMFGTPIVGGFLIEKLAEGDGVLPGFNPPSHALTLAPAANDSWDTLHSDINAYAVLAIVPFSRNFIWRPLVYYIDRQAGLPPLTHPKAHGYTLLIDHVHSLKAGIFTWDIEFAWVNHCITKAFFFDDRWHDWQVDQWLGWTEMGLHPGPFSFWAGGFYVEGTGYEARRRVDDPIIFGRFWNSNSLVGTGGEFQPFLLLFSEDMGLLWNTTGVPNGTSGTSGYWSAYLRASYKINDTMTLFGIIGSLWADKMYRLENSIFHNERVHKGSPHNHLAWEADIGFRWAFMDNIAYQIDVGYLGAGAYFNGFAGNDDSRSVFGDRKSVV